MPRGHLRHHYDEVTGIGVYRSPSVDLDKAYLYFDPIDRLPVEGRERWAKEEERDVMVREAIEAASLEFLEPAVEV
jgi:lysine 2,3-aminomutase